MLPTHTSYSLLTDLYQLTMAYGYWHSGLADRDAAFHLFFRKAPFKGQRTIAAGLATAIDFIERFRFERSDLDYLATLTGNNDEPLFESGFLRYLEDMRLSIDVDGIPEGEVAFPHQPLLRIVGPLAQVQLMETPLLNIMNFQTLIATKAARVCEAAQGEAVLEFGLRRAQGVDGGLSASRAAYIGGCAATSNVLAGKVYGIPVKGTHAHAWVMTFGDEVEAFEKYAEAMPNNCVFLVDTYDTAQGVRHAVQVGKKLRERGHEMVGIRLDSGDLAALSIEARQILDAGGFPDAAIVASNDLDEHAIKALKAKGAKISVWGVGTKLATSYDQPALGGVYKLAAIRDKDGAWQPRMKLSNQPVKVSIPGMLDVWRYERGGQPVGDVIWDQAVIGEPHESNIAPHGGGEMIHLSDCTHRSLLKPVMRSGVCVYDPTPLSAIRDRAMASWAAFSDDTPYPNGLDPRLAALKTRLNIELSGG